MKFVIGLGCLLTALFSAVLVTQNHTWQLQKWRVMVVKTASMAPHLNPGSLVITRPTTPYFSNEIVSFHNPLTPHELITHRILEPTTAAVPSYLTKGDANREKDPLPVKEEEIVGKVFLQLPYVGYPILWAQLPGGVIGLVVIPATVLIYEELRLLRVEVLKIVASRKKRTNHV